MSNQRQIWLGYRLTLYDEPGEGLGKTLVGDWWVRTVGDPSQNWICPDAPLQNTSYSNPMPEYDYSFGTVSSPWVGGTDAFAGGDVQQSGRFNAGSYALNAWLIRAPPLWLRDYHVNAGWTHYFLTETNIREPFSTPLLADGVSIGVWPLPTNGPPFHPSSGTVLYDNLYLGMEVVLIARHGGRPGKVPDSWPASAPLPGGVNISLFDGHVQQVRLDDLWQLQWTVDWKAPAKRPGLP
jgi:prepilin-type processing-associated H-X9-DG protein